MLLNCATGKYSCEALGLQQGNQARQSWWKSTLNIPLERLMLNLKLKCFGHLMLRANSLEKTLMLGMIESKMRREWQRMRWLDSITNSWIWASSGRQSAETRGVLQSMGLQRVRTWLSHWATIATTSSSEESSSSSLNFFIPFSFPWETRRQSLIYVPIEHQ